MSHLRVCTSAAALDSRTQLQRYIASIHVYNNDIRNAYTLEQLDKSDKNLRTDSKWVRWGLYHPPWLGAYEPQVGLAALKQKQLRLDSLRGSSVKIGTIQRRFAWPPRKDDAHISRSVNNKNRCVRFTSTAPPPGKIRLYDSSAQRRPTRCIIHISLSLYIYIIYIYSIYIYI